MQLTDLAPQPEEIHAAWRAGLGDFLPDGDGFDFELITKVLSAVFAVPFTPPKGELLIPALTEFLKDWTGPVTSPDGDQWVSMKGRILNANGDVYREFTDDGQYFVEGWNDVIPVLLDCRVPEVYFHVRRVICATPELWARGLQTKTGQNH